MFRQLANRVSGIIGWNAQTAANAVLTGYRPSQLSEYLEALWGAGPGPLPIVAPGTAVAAGLLQQMGRPGRLDPLSAAMLRSPQPPSSPAIWHHLVYAALLEQTRVVEIFRRIVNEWLHGERLPKTSQATQRWLHVTEQLFFAVQWPFSVRAVTSHLRPDSAAVRRNAYWRMFAWDLHHGTDDGRPYPYVKADAANRDFSTLFESLLAEVWRGYANRRNRVSENTTDNDAIMTLVRRLQEMLVARRYGGALGREEFDAVATLSWFHLTVEHDTAVIVNLQAQGGGNADRLRKLGEIVGLPAHNRSDAYFELAEPMSNVLIAIENGAVSAAGPQSLYNGFYTQDMLRVITHWSIATGRNVKDPALRQPIGTLLTTRVAAEVR